MNLKKFLILLSFTAALFSTVGKISADEVIVGKGEGEINLQGTFYPLKAALKVKDIQVKAKELLAQEDMNAYILQKSEAKLVFLDDDGNELDPQPIFDTDDASETRTRATSQSNPFEIKVLSNNVKATPGKYEVVIGVENRPQWDKTIALSVEEDGFGGAGPGLDDGTDQGTAESQEKGKNNLPQAGNKENSDLPALGALKEAGMAVGLGAILLLIAAYFGLKKVKDLRKF